MSDTPDITPEEIAATGATGAAESPSNIIQLPTFADVPLESSVVAENPQPVLDASGIHAAGQTEPPPATEANTVDLSTITFDEVFADIVQKTKEFAFRLIVSCGLLEQIALRDGFAKAPAATDEPNENESKD